MDVLIESSMKKFSYEFERLEEDFKDIKNHNRENEALRSIQKTLSLMFKQEFVVDVCKNSTGQFFGMTIYPSEELCDMIVAAIVANKSTYEVVEDLWRGNTKWFIEIDSELIDNMSLNTNPSELIAVLLHEIGHTIYANSIPQRLFSILRYEMMNISLKTRTMLENPRFRKIVTPVVLQACNNKYFKNKMSNREETEADKFVVRMGYGDHLNSFLEKLLVSKGTSAFNDSREQEQDTKIIVQWAFMNINELQMRKTKLRSELNNQMVVTPSIYTKHVLKKIKDIFFSKETADKYNKILMEQAVQAFIISEHKKAEKIIESTFLNNVGRCDKIDILDFDEIRVQISSIKTQADKIYTLDLIMDLEDKIDFSLDTIKTKGSRFVPEDSPTLERYKNEIYRLKEEVLKTSLDEENILGKLIKLPNWEE